MTNPYLPDHRFPESRPCAYDSLWRRFASALSAGLSAYLRSDVRADVIAVENDTHAQSLEECSRDHIALVGPSRNSTHAILDIDRAAAVAILDILGVAVAAINASIGEEPTENYSVPMQGICQTVSMALAQATKRTIAPIEFNLGTLDPRARQAPKWGTREALVCVTIVLRIGEHSRTMGLGIPARVIRGAFLDGPHLSDLGRGLVTAPSVAQVASLPPNLGLRQISTTI